MEEGGQGGWESPGLLLPHSLPIPFQLRSAVLSFLFQEPELGNALRSDHLVQDLKESLHDFSVKATVNGKLGGPCE